MTKTADEVLAEFEKKHDLKLGGPDRVTGLTTGNIAIDWLPGIGGLPVGRITELYGFESSGKTTTALQTAKALQDDILDRGSDQRIIYLDFEHALDLDYVESLGIDVGHRSFQPLQPSCLEQGAKVALDLIETGQAPLVVFDSVAAMSPRRLKDGEFDQATIQMHRAKLISALCQSMIEPIYETKTTAVFVNHKMESIDINSRPGLPAKITTPGGRGLKYYASLRLEYNVGAGVKDKLNDFLSGDDVNQLVGNQVYVKCVKNKVGRPGRVVEVRSTYGKGFDNLWTALQILLSNKLARKDGAWYRFDRDKTPTLVPGDADTMRHHGESAVLEFGDENPLWRDTVISLAQRIVADGVETL